MSDSPKPTTVADLAANAAPTDKWLKIFLEEDAFYFQPRTKSYTLCEPDGPVEEEEINWAAEPKRFVKAMRCASSSRACSQ